MKLLPILILIFVCCWGVNVHASGLPIPCQVAGPIRAGASPMVKGPCGGPAKIIPAADIPACGASPCYGLTVNPSTVISLPATATPTWGVTMAQVQQLFPSNILLNFEQNPNLNAAITATGDVELARLSTELARNDVSGYTQSIMMYAGQKLSAANLRRLQAVFSPTVFATAVAYMPAATLAQHNAIPVYAPIPLGVYWDSLNPSLLAGAPGNGDLYLHDLLLVDKTAGAGETTTLALAHVSRYVNARVKNAVVVGIIIAVGLGALQIYDSPTMQALGQQFLQSWWIEFTIPAANRTPVIIQIPDLGNIIPPDIDAPLPTMPPIEGDDNENAGTICPDGCADPT
jgi:hypothetical protein